MKLEVVINTNIENMEVYKEFIKQVKEEHRDSDDVIKILVNF